MGYQMKKRGRLIELFSLVVIITLLFGYPTYFFILNSSEDINHETNSWAIVEDFDGNKLAVDLFNRSIREELRNDYRTNPSSRMFIYGFIESYDNTWQFRFRPSTVSSVTGDSRISYNTILEIANNLDRHLSISTAIRIKSIRFYNSYYAGIIILSIDVIISIISILTFSWYLFSKRAKRRYEKIKKVLLIAKETPGKISFTLLSEKVDLKHKRLEHLINKKNLKEDLGLQITDDCIQFKDLIYSKSVCQIEEQLNNFLQVSHSQLSLEHYGKLFQLQTNLNEALSYYVVRSNFEKQKQIEAKIEVIANLLDSISLDDFKE